MPVARTLVGMVLVYVAGYFLAAYLPLLVVTKEVPFPPFYPPIGVLFAVLLRTERRTWPIWVLLTLPVGAAAHALGGLPFTDTIQLIAADSTAAILGAYLVGRFGGLPFRIDSLRSLAVLIGLGAVVATFPGAVIAASFLHYEYGLPLISGIRYAWSFMLVAIILGTPMILLWDATWPWRWFERRRGAEFTCLMAASIAIPVAVYFLPDLPILSLVMIPLLWAGIRFRLQDAAAVNLVLGLATMVSHPAVLATTLGGQYTPMESTFYVQMFLAFMALGPSLAVAAALLEREQAGDALERGESRLRALLDNAPMVISVRDLDGRYLTVNQNFKDWYGDPMAAERAVTVTDMFPAEVADRVSEVTRQVIEERRAVSEDYGVKFRNGEDHLVRVTHFPIVSSAGRVVAVGAIGSDVTDARRAEDQLRQAQKMDAIGQLTGGIAHDFNNLLAVIIGNLELVLEMVPPEAKTTNRTRIALNAAERGAALTQRLLAFSRKQALKPEVLDVGQVIEGMQPLLERALGEQVAFETVFESDLWPCEADKAQFEAALLNLAINARDAMPDSGTLSVETANVHLDEHYASAQVDLEPGDYVRIAVADTGEGMSAEVLQRAFDPFFTTKTQGRGSGLGLAMVHGFVKQSGGHVSLYSELGHGTTVKIYLPRSRAALPVPAAVVDKDAHPRGYDERVLVVEDDDDVRTLAVALLSELGYQVLEARDGKSAMDLIQRQRKIDLLLTDVVLTGGMTGREVAEAARAAIPEISVLYMSGYTANVIVKQGRLDPEVALLQKPFRRVDLARAVRRALDRVAAG